MGTDGRGGREKERWLRLGDAAAATAARRAGTHQGGTSVVPASIHLITIKQTAKGA